MKISIIEACGFFVASSPSSVRVRRDAVQRDALESVSGRLSHGDRSIKEVPHPDYLLYRAVLIENAIYAFAPELAGSLGFRHREIELK